MRNRFTEQETEAFYDAEDALYRSFWDSEGSLHWGWFDESTGQDFLKACANLNKIMAEKAQINDASNVLDVGCGNGNTAAWLSQRTGCRVTGIDLSGVRIDNANSGLNELPAEIRSNLAFEKASATELPFEDGSFAHAWSQATIYHVHEKEKALQEIHRVLSEQGIFVFDDLIRPKRDISETAQKFVYDRLLFETEFSFQTYQDALQSTGFRVMEAHDLSQHLKKSYQCLSSMAQQKSADKDDKFQTLANAYDQMVTAIDNSELGWALYVCQK
jgi:ubiquinone/menaquinone biosynthesis C-methylase UbiE